jgi:hypothetical protein
MVFEPEVITTFFLRQSSVPLLFLAPKKSLSPRYYNVLYSRCESRSDAFAQVLARNNLRPVKQPAESAVRKIIESDSDPLKIY